LTFTLHSPCTFADLAEAVERATHAQLGMLRAQLVAGTSFALRNGLGEAVACGGLVAMEKFGGAAGVAHAWFVVHEGRGAAAMGQVISTIALTLAAQPYSAIQIEVGTRAGRVMAKRLGFKPLDGNPDAEVWICQQ
jgi:hypothetical protein